MGSPAWPGAGLRTIHHRLPPIYDDGTIICSDVHPDVEGEHIVGLQEDSRDDYFVLDGPAELVVTIGPVGKSAQDCKPIDGVVDAEYWTSTA